MHAISLYQPYPTLLACGAKRKISNSYYARPSPGEEIAIHATITPVGQAYSAEYVEEYLNDPRLSTFTRAALSDYPVAYGAVVATATVREVVGTDRFEFPEHERPLGIDARNEVVWLFQPVRAIGPIMARGNKGLWIWEPSAQPEYLALPAVTFSTTAAR
jgi:hypothetical protein